MKIVETWRLFFQFHDKFGYGEVIEQEGNKLEIEFEQAGRKRVIDSFVTVA